MTEVVEREVLSVWRHGPEYMWFYLRADGMPNLEVRDAVSTWEIEESSERTMAYIRGPESGARWAQSVRIVGPRSQIRSLLWGLGEGTPGNSPDLSQASEGDEVEQ